jgi:hypothetical protein
MTPKERAQRGIRSMIEKIGGNAEDISRGFALFDRYEKEMLSIDQSKEAGFEIVEVFSRNLHDLLHEIQRRSAC